MNLALEAINPLDTNPSPPFLHPRVASALATRGNPHWRRQLSPPPPPLVSPPREEPAGEAWAGSREGGGGASRWMAWRANPGHSGAIRRWQASRRSLRVFGGGGHRCGSLALSRAGGRGGGTAEGAWRPDSAGLGRIWHGCGWARRRRWLAGRGAICGGCSGGGVGGAAAPHRSSMPGQRPPLAGSAGWWRRWCAPKTRQHVCCWPGGRAGRPQLGRARALAGASPRCYVVLVWWRLVAGWFGLAVVEHLQEKFFSVICRIRRRRRPRAPHSFLEASVWCGASPCSLGSGGNPRIRGIGR